MSTGLTEESGQCTEGYYCPGGQATFTPAQYVCPKGFYCPTGSAQPILCARGNVSANSMVCN